MDIATTPLDGVFLIAPSKHGDARGFVSETFRHDALEAHGIARAWVQENHAFSTGRGVVRGLHFQAPPAAQAKLVRVTRGAIFDVAVDLRRASPTYGRQFSTELSAENWRQLYIPAGFAHGYCTLTDVCDVTYRIDAYYAPELESGLDWADPDLAIPWPVSPEAATLSPRDLKWPRLRTFNSPF